MNHSATFNINAHFVGPNPITAINPVSIHPKISNTVYIGPFSSVIGDVTIGRQSYIAPLVSIRADEGSPFFIGEGTNLQDGVILHGLANAKVMHCEKLYSIYIGNHVSCAHNSMIHGPCKLDNDVFIGINAIVFHATVGKHCYISANALITNGVRIPENSFVPVGAIIDTQEKADKLGQVPQSSAEFARAVQRINNEFPNSYSLLFGKTRCSCGLSCCCESVKNIL